ncbi:MAG: TetR/AcrR family transcriptional regulator [Lactobacillales bacterium]|jgi:AcrR family transcriptional regulator|nr:TetR/AcrR family transcriptional regulator [Lactobacillales bacterium]
MAKKKIYTKEQIIENACKIVQANGFDKLTVRNVAKQMDTSTQPIYLEFKSMEDLKEVVVEKILNKLFKITLKKSYTEDPLIDLGLALIDFSNNEKDLFKTLFVENYQLGPKIYDHSYESFHILVLSSEKYSNLSEYKINILHSHIYVMATGLASLISAGIFYYNFEKIKDIFHSTIDRII